MSLQADQHSAVLVVLVSSLRSFELWIAVRPHCIAVEIPMASLMMLIAHCGRVTAALMGIHSYSSLLKTESISLVTAHAIPPKVHNYSYGKH